MIHRTWLNQNHNKFVKVRAETVDVDAPGWEKRSTTTDGFKSFGFKGFGFKNDGFKNDGFKSDSFKNDRSKSNGFKSDGFKSEGSQERETTTRNHETLHTNNNSAGRFPPTKYPRE